MPAAPLQMPHAAPGTQAQHDEEPDDTDQESSGCICSLIDSRAREVGFAAFEPARMTLKLCQYVESGRSSAAVTAMLLRLHDVYEAVVLEPKACKQGQQSEARQPTLLMQQLSAHLPERVYQLPRSAFDDSKGCTALETYCTADSWAKAQRAVAGSTQSAGLYLAFGAAGALLHHLCQDGQTIVLAGSVTLELSGTTANMQLDAGTLDCLEVVPKTGSTFTVLPKPSSKKPRRSAAHSSNAGAGSMPPASNYKANLACRSLLDCLNHTRTSVGARLLRASLIQPLTDTGSLNLRYDAVEELVAHTDLQLNITVALSSLPKRLDKLVSSLALQPAGSNRGAARQTDPSKRISSCIMSVLLLRSTLQQIPSMAAALQGADSALLGAMRTTFSEQAFNDLLQKLVQVMDEEATTSSSPFVNRIQQCFAVKNGRDQMLDVARTAFCRVTEQVHKLAEQYKEQLEQGSSTSRGNSAQQQLTLKVNYTDKQGFFLAISLFGTKQGSSTNPHDITLPKLFQKLDGKRSRSCVYATTQELCALNLRLKDMAHDCLLLTEQVMDELLVEINQQLPLLIRFVDNVALLDMLLGFAQLAGQASEEQPYVRPQLTDRGHALTIVQGRHPLLEAASNVDEDAPPVQPNGTHLNGDTDCMHLITGPNMAGKSTYLKQVGLLVIMAQAGCLVPAQAMKLRPLLRFYTRMGQGDSIETNSSSFMIEMQEVAHILDGAGPRTLVLIDELGRATSTHDGVAVCWAVCEALMAVRAPTLFATHFSQLAELASVYPQARLWKLQVRAEGDHLNYSWSLTPANKSDAWNYGLALAATLGLPQTILDNAKRIAKQQLQAEAQQLVAVQPLDMATLPDVFGVAGELLAVAGAALDCVTCLADNEPCPDDYIEVAFASEGDELFEKPVGVAQGQRSSEAECEQQAGTRSTEAGFEDSQDGISQSRGVTRFAAPKSSVVTLIKLLLQLQPKAVAACKT